MAQNIVAEMITTAHDAFAKLRSEVGEISYGPIRGDHETIIVPFRGINYEVSLKLRKHYEHVFGIGSPLDQRFAFEAWLDAGGLQCEVAS